MITLSQNECVFLKNTLLEAREEFEELVREKEWFVTSTLDLLDSALEILESKGV
jgi:hypothetical protein